MKTGFRRCTGGLVVAALAWALVSPAGGVSRAEAGVLYVDAEAAGANDGSSWTDAFTALQPALEAAQSGDQIWVAAGTYTPSLESTPGDPRSACFGLRNGVAIYGGFAGTEHNLEQRDWVRHPTILSGDLIGDDGPDFANYAENSYHVFYHLGGVDSSAILDGFTISGGYADSGGVFMDEPEFGGGMFNASNSSPTLTHVTFSANSAYAGGGMSNDGSSPTLTDVTFSGNSASLDGGGMYNSSAASPALTDCTFQDNTANQGGGMYNASASSPVLTDCTFSGNLAAESGGGMFNTASSPALTDCTFSANSASAFGGGMYNHSYSSPTLTGCTFTRNSASYAGAIYNVVSCSPVLTDCIFTGNSAIHGGGFLNDSYSSPMLTNCIFAGNRASGLGGGMVNVFSSSPVLINCTFTANSAGRYGGALYNYYVAPTLVNAILWGDTPDELYDEYSQPLVTYSDIQGGYPGEGNLELDPRFVRPPSPSDDGLWGTPDDDYGDLRLLLSPASDAGNNLAVPAGLTADLLGQPRFVDLLAILDTGLGDPPVVDMGAYEAQTGFLFLLMLLR